jgi:hypothetical protein
VGVWVGAGTDVDVAVAAVVSVGCRVEVCAVSAVGVAPTGVAVVCCATTTVGSFVAKGTGEGTTSVALQDMMTTMITAKMAVTRG